MRIVIALALVLCVMCGTACAEEFYPLLTIIVDVCGETDIVTCLDKYGDEWQFFGADCWELGDLCNLLMFDNGAYYTAHEIVNTYWEGHLCSDSLEELVTSWMEAE